MLQQIAYLHLNYEFQTCPWSHVLCWSRPVDTLFCSSSGCSVFPADGLGHNAGLPRWQHLLSRTRLTACTYRRGGKVLSTWTSECSQHCPTNNLSLWQRPISPQAAAENKTKHGWRECRDLTACAAQQCYCKAVR